MTSAMRFLVAAVLLFACDSEATIADGGRDASRLDGGRDSGRRDGGLDAGTDGGSDAGPSDAGGWDAGCRTHSDCESGTACVIPDCVDIADYDCCRGGECPDRTFCTFEACRCPAAGGCCADPSACDRETEICGESCTCVPAPGCAPACEAHEVCMRGRCLPRCFFDGCPVEGDVCGDEGCVPAACSEEECLSMEPPQRCDLSAGCYDACDPDLHRACASSGGSCVLGVCTDASCAPRFIGCSYRTDCCGNMHCVADDAADPPCPPTCTPEPLSPRSDLCRCGLGGGCFDLFRGGRPVPPPRP
jgi:hypothetical protein